MWDLLVTDTAGGGAIAVAGERIAWAGPVRTLPATAAAAVTWSAGGRVVTPGLVDCHTHLLFGGDRANEWEQRLAGADYEAIAAAGGGVGGPPEGPPAPPRHAPPGRAPRRGRGGARRCGRRLLRAGRLHRRPDRPRPHRRHPAGAAGEAACRPAHRPRGRGARRPPRRPLGRSPRAHVARRRRRP